MSKRKRDETSEERYARKMKKYELKLLDKRRRNSNRIIYSSDENDVHQEEHLEFDRTICGDLDGVLSEISIAGNNDGSSIMPENNDLHVEAPEDIFDPELLQALGDTEAEAVEYGEDIYDDIAASFKKILIAGLKKDVKEELTKKYLFPKNLTLAKAPTLNPEIEAMLVDTCRLRDKRLMSKQDQLGRALSALGKAMTSLLKKNPDIPEVVRTLNDAGKLIADSHYIETDTRRSVIVPLVDKSLADPFKNRKRDNYLFGENLSEVVKNSRGIKKTSEFIQAPSSSSRPNLNYKGPPARARQQWSSQHPQSYRAGGQRQRGAPPAQQRRATAFSTRRQPGPPPPPPPHPARRQPQQRQRTAAASPQK